MPYGVPIPAIETAMRAALVANASLTALLQTKPAARGAGPAIYNDGDVYQGQTYPYLTIGAWTQVPDHRMSPGTDGYGWNCTVQIKAVGQRSESQLMSVMNQVAGTFPHGQALAVGGYTFAFTEDFNLQPKLTTTLAGVTTYELPAILRVRVYS